MSPIAERSRALVAVTGLGVGASLAMAVGTGAAAPETTPSDGVALTVVDQAFAVADGESLTVDLLLSESVTADPAAEVVVTLYEPVADSAGLSALDADGPGPAVDSVAVPLAELLDVADPGAGTLTAGLTVPVTLGGNAGTSLDAATAGIHPLSLEIRAGGAAVATASTFVLVTDPDDEEPSDPYPIAVVASIADPGPWADADVLEQGQADLARLVDLATATNAPLTISIPPSLARPADPAAASAPSDSVAPESTPADTTVDTTVDTAAESVPADSSSAASGDAADPAQLLADQIVGDELLGRPLVPLDPSALADIDRIDLFTGQLRQGEEALAAAGPQASRSRTVWVSDVPLTRDGADALRNLGVQMVIVPADVAAAMGVDGQMFAIDLGDGSTMPGIVISPLGEQLATPADGRSASDAAVRLVVETILERDSGSSSGLVLGTGPSGVPDADVTAAFVRHAGETPGLSIVGASKLTGVATSTGQDDVVVGSGQPAVDLTARDAEIDGLRPSADAAASMLSDPAPANRWNGDFVRVLASTVDDQEATERLDEIAGEIDGYLGAVVPPERFTFRITGTSSELPLRIVNNADQALNVVVRVLSPKLETEDLATPLVPGENSVRVPVTARSNGTFSVELTVLTPTDVELARPVVLKADVTGLSGLSRVLTIGALLALASWWYSHFRKRRRLQRSAAGPAIRLEPGPTLSPDAAESRD